MRRFFALCNLRRGLPSPAYLLFLLSLLLLTSEGRAQSPFKVVGNVKDSTGKPIGKVSVKLVGKSNGTSTDQNGAFTLEASPGDVLELTAVGYETLDTKLTGPGQSLELVMLIKNQALGEVVVIGYGTQRKSDLTGAVTSLKTADFNKGVNTSPQQLILGKAPGVRVVQGGGEPGSGVSVSIRGAGSITAGSEPLYVVDGVPLQNAAPVGDGGPGFSSAFTPRNPLSSINPSDIQSMDILKDASATAIYGSRGANGVVIVTTKSGSTGKMKIDYNAYLGKQNPFRQPKLLNPQQYMTTVNQLIDEGAAPVSNKVTGITNGGTDWQKQLYNTGPVIQSHDMAFSGGDNNTRYRLSMVYQNQPGVLINSFFKNYGARLNLDQTRDKFKTGLRLSYDYNDDRYLANGTGFNETAGALNAALNYDPTIPIFDNNGNYTISPFITVDNPLAIANGYTSYGDRYHFLGNIFGEYTFIPGLSMKLNVGTETFTEDRNTYISRVSQYGLASGGIANLLHGSRSSYLSELTAHYNKDFGKAVLDVVAGASYQKFINTNSLASGKGFPSDAAAGNNLALGNPTLATNSSYTADNKLLSYIGRANIGFLNRYLLTATLRVDGSSRFGANNKYGYFPSFAGAWKISNERFFEPIEHIVQDAKLRASWGRTGNQAIGNYNSIPTYVVGPSAVMNDQLVSTVVPSRVPNPNLKWETTQQTDIGLDFGLLNGRITVSADYYEKKTFDMLINLPIDLSTGFGTQLTNIGSLKNNGFEFNITSVNTKGKFSWRTTVNLSTINNKVTSIGGLPQIYDGSSIIKVGLPLRSFFGYRVLGTWQTKDDLSTTTDPVKAGDPKYLDLNGDKTVNTADRVVLGNSFPKISYGVGNYFEFGKFDLGIFIDGLGGIKKYDNNLAESLAPANIRRNRYAEPFLNRWTTSNPTNEWPSFVRQQGSFGVSTYTVRNASYLRVNNIQLGYDLTGSKAVKWARSLRVYATAQNVAMISGYLGDPSINTGGSASFSDSNNPYPQARTFMVGVNLGL
ncbi:MAG: TonB-dependent receptor [Bacteroidetes bacterium]|nr:TonB-dependent receptor [Bacteroidota bacterium]